MSQTLQQKIKKSPSCWNCYKTRGLWQNDKPGARCFCARGLLLRVADRNRAAKQQGEQEIGDTLLPFPGGKAA